MLNLTEHEIYHNIYKHDKYLESLKARNYFIFQYLSFYEQLNFGARPPTTPNKSG